MELSRLQMITKTRLLHFLVHNIKSGNKIPSELSLSKKFEVSRTVIKTVIQVLQDEGYLDKEKKRTNVVIPTADKSKEDEDWGTGFKEYFFHQIQNGFILPGQNFSVLELANNSGCNRTIVREFLYQFSQYGLIEKLPRKMWGMVKIDFNYIDELLTIRERMENSAFKRFFSLNPVSIKFLIDKNINLSLVLGNTNITTEELQKIEKDFFSNLIDVEKNRFIANFHQQLHYITCFIFQWLPGDIFDQIDFRISYLIQLLDALKLENHENCIKAIKEFYIALKDQFNTSLEMLSFP